MMTVAMNELMIEWKNNEIRWKKRGLEGHEDA